MPTVDEAIWRRFPSYAALGVVARGVHVRHVQPAADNELSRVPEADIRAAQLDAWDAAFRSFGAKPKRTPNSASALSKRFVRDGCLPSVNPVVDLYNRISLMYAIPIGGENLHTYVGSPRLSIAVGDEPFETMSDGAPKKEYPLVGEVIWQDDIGTTCRRWNWRQCTRTIIDDQATDLWFVLERLSPMPMESVWAAGGALIEALARTDAGVDINTTVVERTDCQ